VQTVAAVAAHGWRKRRPGIPEIDMALAVAAAAE